MTPPTVLVTIDTEPDDQWTRTPTTSNDNIRAIPRLQAMFDSYGVRPTYFVSYAVARDPAAMEVLGPIHASGCCEIGTHLHAWETPPDYEIDGPLWQCNAYLYQYPHEIQRQKFEAVHAAISRAFGVEPKTYRAGRYGLDGFGVKLLREYGYVADSSVTPMLDWSNDVVAGVPGPDFRTAPLGVYELSEHSICTPGSSGVLEVPLSVGYPWAPPRPVFDLLKTRRPEDLVVRAAAKLLGLRKTWFRPFMHVPEWQVRATAQWLLRRGIGFLNMMFHSSELIPNQQYCPTPAATDAFFKRIDIMIVMAQELGCDGGTTLLEFAETARRTPNSTPSVCKG